MRVLTLVLLISLLGVMAAMAQDEVVGKRPYELDWAGRLQDDHPPLVDFEDLTGWTVQTKLSEAALARTREQQIWDRYVAKLTYRRTADGAPEVRFGPPQPLPVTEAFDCVSCWIHGNNWGYAPNPSTPAVSVSAVFRDGAGQEFSVPLIYVNWEEWHLAYRRLTPEQIATVKKGGVSFLGVAINGGTNRDDRVLYFDNLAVFTEDIKPLTFKPRPERGIPMFPGQTVGTNNGPGKLPFPIRPQTILPDNLTKGFKTSLRQEGQAFVFEYAGSDGKLTWTVKPRTGTWEDISAQWAGRGGPVRPCVDGGVYLQDGGNPPAKPEKAELLSAVKQGNDLVTRWRLGAGNAQAEVTYTYRLWNKSLVVETIAPGGVVGEVRYGRAVGFPNPRLTVNPFYSYSGQRPAVVVSGPADKPLFFAGNTDWYLSNSSVPFSTNEIKDDGVRYQGGTRYITKTDGKRNDCFERFFLTLSPRYEEVLPTIPNPVSPWKHVTGTHLWRAHGAGNREADKKYWANVHRWGCREVVITDHETGWRDGGESFTFRTRPAPGKGGDQGQFDYARFMQDKLGFVYGPYNNFTDFAPVNEYWTPDLIARTPDDQLQGAWMRCYAPKPARAVEYCAELSPINESKFHFSTAYCDVHTAVAPWDRTDYDARVPGAGTFAATFYSYGEVMLLQKKAWDGPVYSEGNNHFWYCGLTDGNYGQDWAYDFPNLPWLVDIDLRQMHRLGCNFGMGSPDMFWHGGRGIGQTPEERASYVDRFLAATVAFGHPGFLVGEGGTTSMLRSYYMLQQLHSRYCLAEAVDIRYADAQGKFMDTSAAVATEAYKRSQVATRYSDGTITIVNGNPTERLAGTVFGRQVDLPSNGYVGFTADGKVEVHSGDRDGRRCDYSVSPAYLYVDGRGRFTRFPKAASDGPGICRLLGKGQYEVLPYGKAQCGFAIAADAAMALSEDNKELGPAELRVARGLTYVMPVEGAFSYRLTSGKPKAAVKLTCARDLVIPGEQVVVKGKQAHPFAVPADAPIGVRLWQQFEGAWIDFSVVALADTRLTLDGNVLNVSLTSNLPDRREVKVTLGGETKAVTLAPAQSGALTFELGEATEETVELLALDLAAGDLRQRVEQAIRIAEGFAPGPKVPDAYDAGMRLRGQAETSDFGNTGAHVVRGDRTSGGVARASLAMHPPWMGGVGYTFALLAPVKLPLQPALAFRALVGKGDGSDLGDGILYKIAVVDEQGKEEVVGAQTVALHEWLPIEGDLSPWVGQTVRMKLITDVGEADDSSGDWAAWTALRLETAKPMLLRYLIDDVGRYAQEPGPFRAPGLTVPDLRGARAGKLHYQGQGLEGYGTYETVGSLNGAKLGSMTRAGGNEMENIWSDEVSVELTPEAIATLKLHNQFQITNLGKDYYKVRRFWIELELADGRKVSSDIAGATFTQPGEWPYAEGVLVPMNEPVTVDIWFPR